MIGSYWPQALRPQRPHPRRQPAHAAAPRRRRRTGLCRSAERPALLTPVSALMAAVVTIITPIPTPAYAPGDAATVPATAAVRATGRPPSTPRVPTRPRPNISDSLTRSCLIRLDRGRQRLDRAPTAGHELTTRAPDRRSERSGPRVLPDEHDRDAPRLQCPPIDSTSSSASSSARSVSSARNSPSSPSAKSRDSKPSTDPSISFFRNSRSSTRTASRSIRAVSSAISPDKFALSAGNSTTR